MYKLCYVVSYMWYEQAVAHQTGKRLPSELVAPAERELICATILCFIVLVPIQGTNVNFLYLFL